MTPMINLTEECHTEHFMVQNSLYLPADTDPAEIEQIRASLRRHAQQALDHLIADLDSK